jgi:phage terminase large subunit
MDERKPWEQMEGESSRWFQRFNAFRLMGPGRSILAVYLAEWRVRQEKAGKSSQNQPTRTPGSWSKQAKADQWHERAVAWDQHLTNLAEAEVEERWRSKIMGSVEARGRMSEFGRNDIRPFFKIVERWTETPLPSEEILKEEQRVRMVLGEPATYTIYKVKKVVIDMEAFLDPELSFRVKEFTDSPKNGIGFKLHDAPAAIAAVGKHTGAFTEPGDAGSETTRIITIPADLLAPPFLAPYRDIRDRRHTEYVFFGGRGSTKSSFISLAIITLLVNNPNMHALGLRQVGETLRDSVYAQLTWAIDQLDAYYPGLAKDFKRTTNPLEITYLPTGQKIYFRGADDAGKIKSIKTPFGYIGLTWFEELDQFHGEEAIRKIEQSAIRGGDIAYIFKSFNPPRTAANWANKYVKIPKPTQHRHTSNYLDVPPEWLGRPWLDEAEFLKSINPTAYEHEYLGVANGTGGLVFENVSLRRITDEEIAGFDRVTWGGDWGYYPDPADFGPVHYDAARRVLYVFGEYRAWKQRNEALFAELVRKHGLLPQDLLILDSAEPKSVADFQKYSVDGVPMLDGHGKPKLKRDGTPIMLYGPTCRGAEKGPDSVKYSIRWLQGLTEIVIDPERCPYAAEEFIDYEYEQDKDGNFISEYPDRNNHSIDRVRYATNLIWRKRGQ